MIYLLRKHDIIFVPSYAEGIYHPFRKERISLKNSDAFASEFFMGWVMGFVCIFALGKNKGSAASSRSGQRSSALHLIFRIPSPANTQIKKRVAFATLFFMGWVMGFEPTNTGTTIRGLRPLGDTHHMLLAECGKWHARRGSNASAASGGRSELSEWQRSTKSRRRVSPKILSGTATGHGVQLKRMLLPSGLNGTPGGTRTPDLLLRRQLLYPAELLAHVEWSG